MKLRLKRLGCIFTVSLMLLGILGASLATADSSEIAEDSTAEGALLRTDISGYEKVVENAVYALYLNTTDCRFFIREKQTGAEYWSNPINADEDSVAEGMARVTLLSQLNITYLDTLEKSSSSIGSYGGSVLNGDVRYFKAADGIKIVYYFADYGFTVPLQITLQEDRFIATVPVEEIKEEKEFHISQIDVLPYLGAAGTTETGNILLPDGSGALVHFNNGRSSGLPYEEQVYGLDRTFFSSLNNTSRQRIALPLYGLDKEKGGFLAVATQGSYNAWIKASVAGMLTSYNTAYFSFSLRAKSVFTIGEDNFNARIVDLIQDSRNTDGNFQITYFTLPEGQSDYVRMAQCYQRYLIEQYDMEPLVTSCRLTLHMWGEIYKTKPIFGIPVRQEIALSPYQETLSLCDMLQDRQITSVGVVYHNWNGATAENKNAVNIHASRVLGGENDLKSLIKGTADRQIPLYFQNDPLTFNSKGTLLSRFTSTAQTLYSYPAEIPFYMLSTQGIDEERPVAFMRKVDTVEKNVHKLINKLVKKEMLFSLGNMTQMLYSDFSREDGGRQALYQTITELVAELGQRGGMLSSFPNEYALPASVYVTDSPVTDSWFTIADETVPFYELVLRGLIPFSVEPLNLADEPKRSFLTAMETGGDLSFVWITKNADELSLSEHHELFSCLYTDWLEQAIQWQKELEDVRSKTDGARVVSRVLTETGLTETVYENGVRLYLNYTGNTIIWDDHQIPSMEYVIK